MKKVALVLACLVFVLTLFAQSDYQTAMAGGVIMVYRTLADNQTLEFTLTAATSGWIAVGFRNQNVMQGANIIIGYAVTSTVNVRDDYGTAPSTHVSDTSLGGTSDITVMGGGDQGGSTMLELHVPLNSGDTYDPPMSIGSTYNIILAQGNGDNFTGQHSDAGFATVSILGSVSGDDNVNPILPALKLYANQPNPFSSSTSLAWSQSKSAPVDLTIFNSRGQIVFRQTVAETTPGMNSFQWNGTDSAGNMLSSGYYFIRISQGGVTAQRKILLLK